MNIVDRDSVLDALNAALLNKEKGKNDTASAWAAELCRLLGCGDIVNTRGRELRRDFHAGPRDAVLTAVLAAAFGLALATPALALQQPTPGKDDNRIRFVNYNPNQVVEIWTAPGGSITIQLADDEFIPEGNIFIDDGSRLERHVRGNFIGLKNTAKPPDTPCMMPEALTIISQLPDGKRRPYHFQIETKPSNCADTPAVEVQRPKGFQLTSTAAAAQPQLLGNLKYVKDGGLAAGADVMYAVKFKYPGAEDEQRTARRRVRAEEAQHREAEALLKQQTSFPFGNPWDGTWHYRYVWHGSMIPPAQVRDNGYQTVFVFPQMQRVPSLFRMQPGASRCNREHDDHNEGTEIPSVHRSASDGDTIIAQGTAQGWCLRDGNTVLEMLNLDFDQHGATPGTGTVSPAVQRVLKGDEANGR